MSYSASGYPRSTVLAVESKYYRQAGCCSTQAGGDEGVTLWASRAR
jgi:hypothetical protein